MRPTSSRAWRTDAVTERGLAALSMNIRLAEQLAVEPSGARQSSMTLLAVVAQAGLATPMGMYMALCDEHS